MKVGSNSDGRAAVRARVRGRARQATIAQQYVSTSFGSRNNYCTRLCASRVPGKSSLFRQCVDYARQERTLRQERQGLKYYAMGCKSSWRYHEKLIQPSAIDTHMATARAQSTPRRTTTSRLSFHRLKPVTGSIIKILTLGAILALFALVWRSWRASGLRQPEQGMIFTAFT